MVARLSRRVLFSCSSTTLINTRIDNFFYFATTFGESQFFFVAESFHATFEPFKRFPTLKSSANVARVRCAVILEMCARGLVKNGLFEKSCATVPTIFRVITQFPRVTPLLLSVYGIIPDRWMAISYQLKKYTFSSSLY